MTSASASATQPCRGLIIAWRLSGVDGQPATPIDAAAVPAALETAGHAPVWLHLDLVDTGAQAFLRGLKGLPNAALISLLEADDHIHLDEADGALFGTIPDFHADMPGHEPDNLGMLHLSLQPGLLVTARRHPLRAVRHLAEQGLTMGSAEGVMAAILRLIADDLLRGRQNLATQLGHIEDALLRPRHIPDRGQLTAVRRDILRLARRFAPVADALIEMREEPPEWLEKAQGFWREARRLSNTRNALESLQDRARLAQDGHANRVAEETNRRLFVLSLISAAMLPASLVAGIFGMNVGGLPGVDKPWGIWLAMGLIIASIAGIMGLLRRFRML